MKAAGKGSGDASSVSQVEGLRRCAFLTLSDPRGYVIDDDLVHAPLLALGWSVENVPWSRPGVVWSDYEIVVIRSTWDYQRRPETFLAVLAEIERSGARLENGLDLVRWNLEKTYLRELAGRGVTTLPTLWRERLHPGELARLFDEIGAEEVVLKPVVGASASGAYRIDRSNLRHEAGEVEAWFADRPLLAQPFASAVLEEGEYSLVYFNAAYSHAIRKTPAAGDYRVQEEHGGHLRSVEAPGSLRDAGGALLDVLGETPLYARADFVRSTDGAAWCLMELELVEPSLYLRLDAQAPARFARAFVARASDREGIAREPLPALEHARPGVAEQIHGVMLAAYRVEARRLGVAEFVPLRRSVVEIAGARSSFYGISRGAELAAVVEVEEEGERSLNVAALVVRPEHFREGLGTALLEHVIASSGAREITVSTGVRNRPALLLYAKQGFHELRRWSTSDGIPMITLVRGAGGEAAGSR